MTVLDRFIHWYYNDFHDTKLYLDMAGTVENSPWHRERDVGVHTDMVVSQYLASPSRDDVRGAFACAFHDVGKPPSEIEKFSEERGLYRAYHGHEQVSARMWEDWAVQNFRFLQKEFRFHPNDLYAVGWMIEHHVPWGTKKDAKLDAFARTSLKTLGLNGIRTWHNVLMADQRGRISDPSHERGDQALEWIRDQCARVQRIANEEYIK